MRALSRIILMSAVATAGLWATQPANAADTVRYDYGNFVLLDNPPTLTDLNAYTQRQFATDAGKARAISAEHGGRTVRCDLALQDAAKANTSDPGVLPIVAYRGCPFTLPFMASERWIELREKITIDITDIRDGVVSVARDSVVPFAAAQGHLPFPAPTAVGVEWRIARAGLVFDTPAGRFETGDAVASIIFTARGPRFRGFRKVPRLAGAVPASNGWSTLAMRSVQERLTRLGYQPGPVDGVWGSRTRDALVAFQRSAGLTGTGKLDARTLLELGI